MQDCSLCKSFSEEKYRVIYEDDYVFVMVNNSPLKDGHVMILPIRHTENMEDLTSEEAKAFLQAADRCMRAAEILTGETAVSVVNGWKHRSEPHLHLHVVPSKNNLRGLLVASEGVERRVLADTERLEQIAKRFLDTFHTV